MERAGEKENKPLQNTDSIAKRNEIQENKKEEILKSKRATIAFGNQESHCIDERRHRKGPGVDVSNPRGGQAGEKQEKKDSYSIPGRLRTV